MGTIREVFTSPVGRLVQGDCFSPQTKDQQGNLRVVKTGPNAGQPNPQFFVSIAIPKVSDPQNPAGLNPEFSTFYGLLDRVARTEWPALFPTPGQPCVNPRFAFKVKDGDGVDQNGKSNADKQGFAGHWIVSFASSYAPKVVKPTAPNVWETLTDPAAVKRGYYIRVAGSTTGNDNAQNPGIYLNLDMIELVGYGPEIVSGPDAETAFGAHPVALPPGASSLPVASAAPMPPGSGAPQTLPSTMPPTTLPGNAPAAPAAPAAAPSLPTAPSAAPGSMTPAANGLTWEQYHASGWTDEQLIAAGYMVAGAPAPAPHAGFIPAPVMTPAANGLTREQYHASGWTDEQLIAQGFMIA